MNSVLIVEQDHNERVRLRKILEESFGLTIFSAANPIEGLAILQKIKPPTVILLSTQLPLMTYTEFLEIKGRDESVASVPVILLTNSGVSDLPEGTVAVVNKPVTISDMTVVLREHCGLGLK